MSQEINKNTICAVPWMHLAFEPSGKIIPCCLTSTHKTAEVGNLNDNSLEEIWNSDRMKQMRVEMMNGIEPKICNKCFDREKVTGESGRTYHNRDFNSVIKSIPEITLEDGTATEMKLRYWDMRFSNLCNLKCRSCGPDYSSAWVPDAKKMGSISEQDKVWNITNVDDEINFDFLKSQIPHVEKIYFAGGEPLLMPEHWQILDLLVEQKRFNVKISYNTNASKLTYGGKNVLDYWKKWNPLKCEVWPSIDEIGDRAELIRAGTNWKTVEKNLIAMSELDNIILRPGITVGAWNVFRLPEIINKFVELNIIKRNPLLGIQHNNFFINLLELPAHYHVSILPEWFRKETITKLENFIKEFNQKYDTDLNPRFEHILYELKKPFNAIEASRFIHITEKLDKIRNENTFETIPEINCIKEALNKNIIARG